MRLLSLALSFLKIGVVSFGGGWSIVGLIKAEIVPRWMDDAAFRSLVAIAQATPGPVALNAATLVGWQQGGWLWSIVTTLAVIAFPVAAIAGAGLLARLLKPSRGALNEALKSGTLAMMLMTLWTLRPTSLAPLPLALGLASFALVAFTKVSPLWAIFGAGGISALVGVLSRA
jgi:chromate transporter